MKLGYLASGILLAATTYLVPAANAQPVNLTCKDQQTTVEGRVTFDESAQTAGFRVYGPIPALHATFTDTEIKWVEGSGKDQEYFTLSRSTGALRQGPYRIWQCTVAEKKF